MKHSRLWLASILKRLASALNPAENAEQKPKAANERTTPKDETSSNPPISRTIIEIPDSIVSGCQANQDQQHRDNQALFWVTLAAVIGALIYAFIAFLQWDELSRTVTETQNLVREQKRVTYAARDAAVAAQRSAMAAERANNNATRSLRLTERAWVTAQNLKLIEPIKLTSEQFSVNFELMLTNSGKAVARDGSATAYAINATGEEIRNHLSNDCKSEKKSRSIAKNEYPFGFLLAPRQTAPYEMGVNTRDITAAIIPTGHTIYITGCIIYDDQFGERSTHFCFTPKRHFA